MLNPAHAIFFSGCTATCTFCTAAKFAFRPTYGVAISPQQLAARILQRQAAGARSVCFIGGDPTPHIPFILETLHILGEQRHIPSVFNSNLYITSAALNLLAGNIDIYLPDLKFGPGGATDCGAEIGGMPDYWPCVTDNLQQLWEQGEQLIVRHLLMPGHFACCTVPVLEWLAARPGLKLSLLTQYLAVPQAQGKLAETLSDKDIHTAYALAQKLRLTLVH